MARFPHIYPKGGTLFITFRLKDSLPQDKLKLLKGEFESEQQRIKNTNTAEDLKLLQLFDLQRRTFGRYDAQLDKHSYGSCLMNNTNIAKIIHDKIQLYHTLYYCIIRCCIMPNHVHLLVDTSCQISENTPNSNKEYVEVSQWMKLIKGGSAFLINKELNRKGTIWVESFDHYSRSDSETERIKKYIEENPIKAGLCIKFLNEPYLF